MARAVARRRRVRSFIFVNDREISSQSARAVRTRRDRRRAVESASSSTHSRALEPRPVVARVIGGGRVVVVARIPSDHRQTYPTDRRPRDAAFDRETDRARAT
jgi:hypothetical protein